jgi:hypothetical protein
MADGYPVHNYGTDPLGKMGLLWMQQGLDWDEKQKALEAKAIQDEATSSRSAFLKSAEAGTADPNAAYRLYEPDIARGVMGMSQAAKVTKIIQQAGFLADNAKKQQELTNLEVESALKSVSHWKKIKEQALIAEDTDLMVAANDNLKILGQDLYKKTGYQHDFVAETEVSQGVDYKMGATIKVISDLTDKLNAAVITGELPKIVEANAALSKQLQLSALSLKQKPSDAFPAAASLAKETQEKTIPELTKQMLTPKTTVPLGTIKDVDNPDGTKSQVRFDGIQDGQQVWTNIGRSKPEEKSDDTAALQKKTSYIAKVLGVTEKEALPMALNAETKTKFISKIAEQSSALGIPVTPAKIKEWGDSYDLINGKQGAAPPVDKERENAQAAIAAGKDPTQVKKIYKQRTGKDF